jgi:hypothetical protein
MEADYSGDQSSPWAVAPRGREERWFSFAGNKKNFREKKDANNRRNNVMSNKPTVQHDAH